MRPSIPPAPPPTPPRLRLRSKLSIGSLQAAAMTAVSYAGVGSILSGLKAAHQHHRGYMGDRQEYTRGLEAVLREDDGDRAACDNAPTTLAADTTLNLTTHCQSCHEPVSIAVPQWMTAAIDGSAARSGGAMGGSREREEDREERRNEFVDTIVALAVAIKASPIPHLMVGFFKYLFAISLYLDARFMLHQRLAILLANILEGLIEIEKEVGLFRGLGEGLSVLWEASVKGSIAFAKAESSPSDTPPFPVLASSTQQSHSYSRTATKASHPPSPSRIPTSRHSHNHNWTSSASHTAAVSVSSSSVAASSTIKPLLLPTMRRSSRSSTSSSNGSNKSPNLVAVPLPTTFPSSSSSALASSNSAPASPRSSMSELPSYSSAIDMREERRSPTSGMRNRSRSVGAREREEEEREEQERERERARFLAGSNTPTGWAGRVVGAAVGRIRG